MLPIALIILGIVSRLVPHVWNFTPVLAVAFFSGAVLPRRYALGIPLAVLLITDAVLGWHSTMPFTWLSVVLIVFLGGLFRERRSAKGVALGSLAAAVLFFAVSNFGAWLALYPRTMAGFLECYAMAVPFFRNTLAGTLAYGLVLFGVYEVFARTLGSTRFAKFLFWESRA
jgi:hypothetical protein